MGERGALIMLEIDEKDLMHKGIRLFMRTNRNDWVYFEWGKIYLRQSRRPLVHSKQLTKCLDIATIEVYPNFREKGIASGFIKIAHDTNPHDATFIEQVGPYFLQQHLLSNGYIRVKHLPNNFFKLKD